MARVTVEDCIVNVPNRFELVLLAAKRARELSAGAPLTIARDNDKNAVVSLREISEQTIDLESLRERIIKGLQRNVVIEGNDKDSERDVAEDLEDVDNAMMQMALEQNALLSDEAVRIDSDEDIEDDFSADDEDDIDDDED